MAGSQINLMRDIRWNRCYRSFMQCFVDLKLLFYAIKLVSCNGPHVWMTQPGISVTQGWWLSHWTRPSNRLDLNLQIMTKNYLTIQLTVKTTDDVGTGISAPLVARVLPPPPLRKNWRRLHLRFFLRGGGGSVHRVVSVLYRVKQKDWRTTVPTLRAYHLCNDLFRITWEMQLGYLRVLTVNIQVF